MKVDLENNWVVLCLAPFGVSMRHMDKFVACLLGDELCTQDEFAEMFSGANGGNGAASPFGDISCCKCKYCMSGACFHPFLPGSIMDAIFSSSFRGVGNGGAFVNEDAVHLLDNRKFGRCSMFCPYEISDTAFGGMQMFYDRLIEDACRHCSLFGVKFEKFRNGFSHYIDERDFFDKGSPYEPYIGNIRRHFDSLMERHFKMIDDAISGCMSIDIKGTKKAISNAITRIKWELVTHYMSYWMPENFKKEK